MTEDHELHLPDALTHAAVPPPMALTTAAPGDALTVESGDVVNRIEKLKYLIIETAFCDADYSRAEASGHLCPKSLADSLEKLERPAEVFITHMKPGHHETIMDEISARPWASPPRQLTCGQVLEF